VGVPYVATGAHVRTYAVKDASSNRGLAVARDGSQFAVSNDSTHMITVYSTVDGSETVSFGGRGAGPGQFSSPSKLCTSPRDTLLVADCINQRVQEVTFSGVHIRDIGVGVFGDGIYGIACNDQHIAVTKFIGATPNRVLLFNCSTGELLRQFAGYGSGDGHIAHSTGVRFTPDNQHIIVVDTDYNDRLSMFTVDGVFVKHIGVGVLGGGDCHDCDVDFTADGRIIVADCCNHRVCIFAADGVMTSSWGTEGTSDGQFKRPTTLAVSGGKLLVLDCWSARVQVFD